jgi:hypothetical protein
MEKKVIVPSDRVARILVQAAIRIIQEERAAAQSAK